MDTNNNSESPNQLEEIKWLISRLDHYHKLMSESLRDVTQTYETAGTKANSALRGTRNNLLSAAGIAITILLGVNSVYTVEAWQFYSILIPILVAGLAIYIIFNLAIRAIEDLFISLVNVVREQEFYLSHSSGYITTSVAILSKVKYEYVYNYQIFIFLLTSAMMLSIAKELRKIARKYGIRKDIKSVLIKEAKSYEGNTDFIPKYYQLLDRSQNVPEPLMKFIDSTLSKYKKEN